MSEEEKKGSKCSFSLAAFDMFGSPVAFNIRGDETYKTVMGCFWSAIMLFSLFAAFGWYFLVFYNKTDGEVISNIETQDSYPRLNFYESGFFLTLYATYDKRTLSIQQLSDTFKIEATLHIEDIDQTTGVVTENVPLVVPFEPCVDSGKSGSTFGDNNIELQGAGVNGKALSNDALCSVASESKPLYVQGTDDEEKFVYFRIKILPCDSTDIECGYFYEPEGVRTWMNNDIGSGAVTASGKTNSQYVCGKLFSNEGKNIHGIGVSPSIDAATCDCGTIDNLSPGSNSLSFSGAGAVVTKCNEVLQRIPKKIEEVTSATYFTLSYTEGAVKPDNYDQPFVFFLKTGARIYGSVENTKLVNMFWKEVEVNTDKGLVFENIETKTTLSLDNIIIDTLDRGSGKTRYEKDPNGGIGDAKVAVPQSFIEFNLYSSNNKLIFNRQYSKLVDVFANIGGISEVIGFVVVFCYAWYNGIRMEQKLLNYGVLNKKMKRDAEDIKNKLGNDDAEWEKKRHFKFSELCKFGLMEKGIGCCFKSKKMMKRREFYEEVKECFEQRTDVINIMKGVSDVDTLKEALLTPYQLRLMHYLATTKADDESNEKEMSINSASKELKNRNKKLSPLQEQIDAYLRENLPPNILAGDFTEEDEVSFNKGKVIPLEIQSGKEGSKHTLDVAQNKEMHLMSPCLSPRSGKPIKRKRLRSASNKLKQEGKPK